MIKMGTRKRRESVPTRIMIIEKCVRLNQVAMIARYPIFDDLLSTVYVSGHFLDP